MAPNLSGRIPGSLARAVAIPAAALRRDPAATSVASGSEPAPLGKPLRVAGWPAAHPET